LPGGSPKTKQDVRVARALAGYFSGRVLKFAIPLDLSGTSPFQRKVLQSCAAIPLGSVTSYAELARKAGKPRAARAVGTIMATNPISIVIPCHRVVGSDRKLHGYGGGLAMKRKLLELEGVRFEGRGTGARVLPKQGPASRGTDRR
jgi:methylated-DNA-[protein]-cysteine S-methyltransferase